MSGYHILGGIVPPFQVLQQQNAGLPPGGIPPWYAMQYPAGYVPPLLVSVDNPMEADPFDAFEYARGEREQRGLEKSHLISMNAPTYLGDTTIGSLSDYSYGENQVLQLNHYFNALGRPKEFEPEVEAIWSNYERTRTSFATLAAFVRSDSMKQLGAQAAALQTKIASFKGQLTPTRTPTNIYDPTKDNSLLGRIPWWVYAIAGTAAVGAVGYLFMPFLLPILARRASLKVATGV